MAFLSRSTPVARALLVLAVGLVEGSRTIGPNDGATGSKQVQYLFADPNNLICGGGEIRKMLADSPSRSKIRTMSWDKIEKIASVYITKQHDVVIPKLERQVSELTAQIAAAEQSESPDQLSDSKIKELLTTSIGAENSYKSVETAKAVQCGAAAFSVRKAHKVARAAFSNTIANFQGAVEQTFAGGSVRTTADKVIEVCLSMVFDQNDVARVLAEGADDSECDELCTQLSEEAQTASDMHAGVHVGATSAALRAQLQEVTSKLQYERLEEDECRRAQQALVAFAEQLKQFSAKVKTTFTLKQNAKYAYEEALEAMEDMEETQVGNEANAEAAQKALEASGAVASGLVDSVQKMKVSAKEAGLTAARALETAQKAIFAVEKATEAYAAVEEIKALVAQTMMQMKAFFDAAMVEPVVALGLGSNTDLEEYFNQQNFREKELVETALENMDSYCKTTAKPAFAKVKHTVDLTPICEFGQVGEVSSTISAMIGTRRDAVKETLLKVQQQIETFKGAPITAQEIQQKLADGEPMGLREIISPFGMSEYYRNYLKHWKLNDQSSFVALCKDLSMKVEELKKYRDLMNKNNEAMQQALATANGQLKNLQSKLKLALAQKSQDQQKLGQMKSAVEAQQKDIEQQSANLEALLAKLRAAEKAFNEAQEALTAAHAEGTNLGQNKLV